MEKIRDEEVLPGCTLKVESVPHLNCSVFVGGINKFSSHDQIKGLVKKLTKNIKNVDIPSGAGVEMSGRDKNPGFFTIEYDDYKSASNARRTLTKHYGSEVLGRYFTVEGSGTGVSDTLTIVKKEVKQEAVEEEQAPAPKKTQKRDNQSAGYFGNNSSGGASNAKRGRRAGARRY